VYVNHEKDTIKALEVQGISPQNRNQLDVYNASDTGMRRK